MQPFSEFVDPILLGMLSFVLLIMAKMAWHQDEISPETTAVRKTVVNVMVCVAIAGVIWMGIELSEAIKYYLNFTK